MTPSARPTKRTLARRLAMLGLAGSLSVATLASLSGCEKPRDKAMKIERSGSLIGVTIEEGNKIVGINATKHDDYNYYWDMGKGNGVIQVLVRGGKITRVEFVEAFEARAARDNTPSHPDVTNERPPSLDELEGKSGSQKDSGGTPPAPTGG